jgi:putative aminopeptidase FrvX
MVMTADFVAQRQQLIDLCIQIQQVAAPTGMEGDRARWVADWLRRCGYADVVVDELDNVYACLEGEQRRPAVLVSAHTCLCAMTSTSGASMAQG